MISWIIWYPTKPEVVDRAGSVPKTDSLKIKDKPKQDIQPQEHAKELTDKTHAVLLKLKRQPVMTQSYAYHGKLGASKTSGIYRQGKLCRSEL